MTQPLPHDLDTILQQIQDGSLSTRNDWWQPIMERNNPKATATLKVDLDIPGFHVVLTRVPNGENDYGYVVTPENTSVCAKRREYRPVECEALGAKLQERVTRFMALRPATGGELLSSEELTPLLKDCKKGIAGLQHDMEKARGGQGWAHRPNIPAPAPSPDSLIGDEGSYIGG